MKPEDFRLTKIALLSGAAMVSLCAAPAFSQEPAVEAQLTQDTIVVTGVRASLAEGLDIKRQDDAFIDALVAEDFAEFPDANLGEALQRIPGITVERQDGGSQSNAVGEGATINVRGLGSAFTRTEINGMTAPNAGQDRGFGFNILSSDLFASAVVRKSLSAADNEGGLAGTVQLNTYRPFDFSDRVLNLSGRGTYTELNEETAPAGSAIFVDQFAGGRFGIAVGLAYDETKPRENIADVSNWDFLRDSMRANFTALPADQQASLQDLVIPRDPRIMINDRDQQRLNATLTLQARPTDNLTITFDNIYANVDHTGRQLRNDYPIEGFPATFVPADLVRNGDAFVSGTFPSASHFGRILDYEYDVQTSLYQGILSADWDLSETFTATGAISYSSAEEDFRKWNVFELRTQPTDILYEVVGDVTTYGLAVGDAADPAIYNRLTLIRNRPDADKDDELAARFDFEWRPGLSIVETVEFGARWDKREKSFRAFDGRATLGTVADLSSYLTTFDFDFDGAPQGLPSQIVGVRDFAALQNAADPDGFDLVENQFAGYDVTEETLGAYAMANFMFNAVSGNVGVRVVSTDQTSDGFERVDGVLQPASFSNDYTYALPSLNAKWQISEDLVGRLAVYRSLTRPELTDIQPGRSFAAFDGGNGTSGNSELDPFTSTNFDIGLEWYFGEGALLSASYFRKDLNGLIERIVEETQVTDQVTGQTYTINLSRPVNGESAEINGFEIGLQTPFFFLPEPFNSAGFVANATLTDSSAQFSNQDDIRSSSLPGLSETSYNAILYYDAAPVSARLAYNWRSDYLLTVSGSGGNPVSRDDYGQLDFSSAFDVNDQFSVTFDVLNLTDEEYRSFSFQNEDLAKGLVQSGRRFVVGANYKF